MDENMHIIEGCSKRLKVDLSPFEWNFDLDKFGQKFHHSLIDKITNIPKLVFRMI
jgi:hypothetical protein